MATQMTLYDCDRILSEIDAIAAENDGEITEEQMKALVEAQTTSIAKLGKLCGFMKYLEHGIDACKKEEERIAKMRKTATNRLKSVKHYLLPYLKEHGKTTIDTFTLSTRKSTAVAVDEPFFVTDPDYKHWSRHIPESWEPDKAKIKAALKDGVEIQGCSIEERVSVQLK